MKLYEVIIDNGEDVYKEYGCAKNKKEFAKRYSGNGEFVRLTDVTNKYLNFDSVSVLDKCLKETGWGKAERTILCELLMEHLEKNRDVSVIGG